MSSFPKLGIIAGGGVAPRQIIEACRVEGRPFFVFCLEGQADPSLAEGVPHVRLGLGSVGKLRDFCVAEKIEEMVLIGRVRRPSIAELKPDWLGVKLLAKIGLNGSGDDGLLRAVGAALEEMCGVRLIGAHEVDASLLTPEGVLTKARPDAQALRDIAKGVEAARDLGRRDIGQAAIISGGEVLGLEDSEGTNALIAKSASAKKASGGVLVKGAKPQQDDRFDLPSLGPETIEHLARAGLAGVAVEAGRSLLLEREKTLQRADALGVFIVGFKE